MTQWIYNLSLGLYFFFKWEKRKAKDTCQKWWIEGLENKVEEKKYVEFQAKLSNLYRV